MIRIYTADNVAMAWHIRNILEQYDIYAEVKNENIYSVAGEIPMTEGLPEVWVKPLYAKRAEEIIKEQVFSDEIAGKDWICDKCGEENAQSFNVCWQCQTSSDVNHD